MKRFWARLPITDLVSGGDRWHLITSGRTSPPYISRCGREFKDQALEISAERPNIVRGVCRSCERGEIADRTTTTKPKEKTDLRDHALKAIKRVP